MNHDRTHHDNFHAGERAVQHRAGQAHIAEQRSGMVSATVMAGARPFIAGQFMVVLASVDNAGQLWSSVLFGQPGMAHADADAVLLDVPAAARDAADPLWANLVAGADSGADASHRGGNRGFVQLLDESTLRIPDYHGNSMFNTLGNFAIDPMPVWPSPTSNMAACCS